MRGANSKVDLSITNLFGLQWTHNFGSIFDPKKKVLLSATL